MEKKVVVVDLDGTFIGKNTFHMWIKFLIAHSLIKPHIIIHIFLSVFMRIFNLIPHEKLKYKIIKITNSCSTNVPLDKFIDKLKTYVNKQILSELNNRSENEVWILSTAAPSIYAEKLANFYNFDYYIATPMVLDEQWKENIREVKFQNVDLLLKKMNLGCINVLYTDHHDDLHLIEISQKVYLVDPSEETKNEIKKIHEKKINIIHY